jgi:hypothetical protein
VPTHRVEHGPIDNSYDASPATEVAAKEIPQQMGPVQPLDPAKDLPPRDIARAAFTSGYAEGSAARERNSSIPICLRVAMDAYADGFRSAYFPRSSGLSGAMAGENGSSRDNPIGCRRHGEQPAMRERKQRMRAAANRSNRLPSASPYELDREPCGR